MEDETYRAALGYIQHQCREQGIDAALNADSGTETTGFDALLLCDRKGSGQQIAAQAGENLV